MYYVQCFFGGVPDKAHKRCRTKRQAQHDGIYFHGVGPRQEPEEELQAPTSGAHTKALEMAVPSHKRVRSFVIVISIVYLQVTMF